MHAGGKKPDVIQPKVPGYISVMDLERRPPSAGDMPLAIVAEQEEYFMPSGPQLDNESLRAFVRDILDRSWTIFRDHASEPDDFARTEHAISFLIGELGLEPRSIISFQDKVGARLTNRTNDILKESLKLLKDAGKLDINLVGEEINVLGPADTKADTLLEMITRTFLVRNMGKNADNIEEVCYFNPHAVLSSREDNVHHTAFSMIPYAPEAYLERFRELIWACQDPKHLGSGIVNIRENQPPVAKAVYPKKVLRGTWVTLDGRESSDPDAHPDPKKRTPLKFFWHTLEGSSRIRWKDQNASVARMLVPHTESAAISVRLSVFDGISWGHEDFWITPNAIGSLLALDPTSQLEVSTVFNEDPWHTKEYPVSPGMLISLFLYIHSDSEEHTPHITSHNIDDIGACFDCTVDIFEKRPTPMRVCYPHDELREISTGTYRMDITVPEYLAQNGHCSFDGIERGMTFEIEHEIEVSDIPFRVDFDVHNDTSRVTVYDIGLTKKTYKQDEPVVLGATLYVQGKDRGADLSWNALDTVVTPKRQVTRDCDIERHVTPGQDEGVYRYEWDLPPFQGFSNGRYTLPGKNVLALTVDQARFTLEQGKVRFQIEGDGEAHCAFEAAALSHFMDETTPFIVGYRRQCERNEDYDAYPCTGDVTMNVERASRISEEDILDFSPGQELFVDDARICLIEGMGLLKGVYRLSDGTMAIHQGCYTYDLPVKASGLLLAGGDPNPFRLAMMIPNPPPPRPKPKTAVASSDATKKPEADEAAKTTAPEGEGVAMSMPEESMEFPVSVPMSLSPLASFVSDTSLSGKLEGVGDETQFEARTAIIPAQATSIRAYNAVKRVTLGDDVRVELAVDLDGDDEQRALFEKQNASAQFPQRLKIARKGAMTLALPQSDYGTRRTKKGLVYWATYAITRRMFTGSFHIADSATYQGKNHRIKGQVQIGSGTSSLKGTVGKKGGAK